MADQEGRRRRFRRTGPFSGVAALVGTTSLRMTGHSASHPAQRHSRMTVGPLSVCCKLTLPTCPHLGQTGGTNKEKFVGPISKTMMCSRRDPTRAAPLWPAMALGGRRRECVGPLASRLSESDAGLNRAESADAM
jgi:hypothetical protein